MQLGAYTINNKIATIENTALNCFNPYPSSWHFCINMTASGVTSNTAISYYTTDEISYIKLGINQFPASGLNNTRNHYSMQYYPNIGGGLQPIWPMTDWHAGVKSAAEMDPISGCLLYNQNNNIAGPYTLYMDYRSLSRYILPEGNFRFCFGIPTIGNGYGYYYEAAEIYVVDTAKVIYTAWRPNPSVTGTAYPTCYFFSAKSGGEFTGQHAGRGSAKEIVPITANFNIQYPNEITGYGDINGTFPDTIIL